MLLVSDDLNSMTVWTILYYARYLGKLSTRSRSYLCSDLPLLLENTTTVVVSGCRPLARGLRSNVIKLRYVSTHTRLHRHTLTYNLRSNFTFCVGAIINVFNQIHCRWCHKTDSASMWHNINGTWMHNATWFQTPVAFISCDTRLAVFHSNCILFKNISSHSLKSLSRCGNGLLCYLRQKCTLTRSSDMRLLRKRIFPWYHKETKRKKSG